MIEQNFKVINGSFQPEKIGEQRTIISDGMILTVSPGKTSCYVKNGHKFPMGGKKKKPQSRLVRLFKAELDGVKVFAHKRDGIMHIMLTKDEIMP